MGAPSGFEAPHPAGIQWLTALALEEPLHPDVSCLQQADSWANLHSASPS